MSFFVNDTSEPNRLLLVMRTSLADMSCVASTPRSARVASHSAPFPCTSHAQRHGRSD